MERNQISDKELQMILDYFKQFQIRLAEMNIDDLMLKVKENRISDKEKAKIDEDFATMRNLPDFREPTAKPIRDAGFTDEEIAAIIAAANTPMNASPVLTQPEIDAIVDAMTKKLRDIKATGPILTQAEIDAIVGDLAGKLRVAEPALTQSEIDAIVDAMTKKLHKSQRPALNEKQIDYIIQITRTAWVHLTEAEKKEILGNIPFL